MAVSTGRTEHDELMRRALVAAGLCLLAGLGPWMAQGAGAATRDTSQVRTVLSGLSSPEGIAVDAVGDLFVADTGHCRVLMVPSHSGVVFGRDVVRLRHYVVAGSRCGLPGGLSYPSSVAVSPAGNLFIAEASTSRVVMVRPSAPRRLVPIAGTGHPGYDGDGQPAPVSELNEPSGIATDAAGNLFIADTANCRVREVPAVGTSFAGQVMTPLDIYTVAGTGVCGSAGLGGLAASAQLANPVAVAIDRGGNLIIADNGEQTVLAVARVNGAIAQLAGMLGNGPYGGDGLSATGATAELNDPEGVAISPLGTLYVADGFMHAIRIVPTVATTVLGRPMSPGDMYTLIGAVPINTSAGLGNGTQWVVGHIDRPSSLALSPFGGVFFSDSGTGQVREVG